MDTQNPPVPPTKEDIKVARACVTRLMVGRRQHVARNGDDGHYSSYLTFEELDVAELISVTLQKRGFNVFAVAGPERLPTIELTWHGAH